jgi:hypothetical protein
MTSAIRTQWQTALKMAVESLPINEDALNVLIPEQAAPLFRNDGAPLFRSIAARGSD